MSNFAKGKHAKFISDRSGMEFPYKEMVKEWNGSRVHISEFEPKQPQLEPKPHGADPQGLPMAKPPRTEPATQNLLSKCLILQKVNTLKLYLIDQEWNFHTKKW